METEESLPNPFYEASLTKISNPGKDTIKKEGGGWRERGREGGKKTTLRWRAIGSYWLLKGESIFFRTSPLTGYLSWGISPYTCTQRTLNGSNRSYSYIQTYTQILLLDIHVYVTILKKRLCIWERVLGKWEELDRGGVECNDINIKLMSVLLKN